MNRIRLGLLGALTAVVALVGVTMFGATNTANAMPPTLFRITITNTTSPAMPISPGIILPHIDEGVLWVSGGTSGAALELLAEVGNPSALIDALNGQLIGEIAPGGSASIEIVIENEGYLSTASMLVATNDSFVGLNSVILWDEDHLPIDSQTFELNAYDAGTEANTELGSGFDGGQPDPSRGAENLDNGEATSELIARSDQFSSPQATITIEVVYEDELEAGDDPAMDSGAEMDSGDDGVEEESSLETDEGSMPAEQEAMDDDAKDEVAVDEVAVDEDATDEDATDEDAMDDDAMDDDAMDDDAMDEDAMDEDAMDEDAMDDDAMDEDAMDDDAMDEDAMDEDAMDEDAMGDGESMTDDAMPNTGTGGLAEGSGIGATLTALIALAALAAAASVYGVARVAARRR